VLSTKVGRYFKVTTPDKRDGIGKFFDVPARREVYDYTYDGVMRSVEFSLERLGVDRIDILFAHDLDIFNHGSRKRSTQRSIRADGRWRLQGAGRTARTGRDQGLRRRASTNGSPAQTLTERGDFDLFLLAGRYTLLEQEALRVSCRSGEDAASGS
jgi:D-threo-aldose 1-dehydrogenase